MEGMGLLGQIVKEKEYPTELVMRRIQHGKAALINGLRSVCLKGITILAKYAD